jgi:uncharacterized membrane protein SpoIIM required for sporulation
MREKKFVEQNQESWIKFEEASQKGSQIDPETFNDLFSQITEDLSYSRTQYPKRSIRVYLNALAQRIYLKLHQRRSSGSRSFLQFWKDDLPLALYQAKRELNISLIFFLAAMLIGVISSIHDPDFANVILGEGYVEMTKENIENGDPMGVYKQSGELEMFLAITINNILVAFRTFVLGAFLGVGTLIIMLYNGIMVGTFQYFFIERGLLQESFLTIWMHGALEISSIVIAGAAGLTMGRGLLYPGTLPRKQAFIIGARRAIKIMLGLVPLFIIAGFIEGFFTRLTEMPDVLRGTFIGMCFLFIGTYFWWYPSRRYRGTPRQAINEEELILEDQPLPMAGGLRKTTEIFNSTFIVFRKSFFQILLGSLGIAVAYAISFFVVHRFEVVELITISSFDPFNAFQFRDYSFLPSAFFLNTFLEVVVIFFCMKMLKRAYSMSELNLGWRFLLKVIAVVLIFELSFLANEPLVATAGMIGMPFLLFWLVVATIENSPLPKAFGSMLALLNGTRRYILVSYLMFALLSALILMLLASPFTWFYVDVLQWNIEAAYETKELIAILVLTAIDQFGISMIVPLLLISQFFEYFSAKEAKHGSILLRRVKRIGVKRKAYGMEQE